MVDKDDDVEPLPHRVYIGLAESGEIDRSVIDYARAVTALSRGYSIADVKIELERVSLKAASLSGSTRESYVRKTVRVASSQVRN